MPEQEPQALPEPGRGEEAPGRVSAADTAGTAPQDDAAATAKLSLRLDPIQPEPGGRQPWHRPATASQA